MKPQVMSTPRDHLLKIFRSAVSAVHGTPCVERFLTARHIQGEVFVLAVGKAAAAMVQGAHNVLGEQLRRVLLVTKSGYLTPEIRDIPGMTVIEAGHPVPDEASLRAGRAMLDFIASTPGNAQLLFLISGGTSSLLEILPQGISLSELQRANQWLLGSGLDIHAMNALRKQLSCIKGGRLSAHLQGRSALQVLVSDVPGDNPADIGSGLLVPQENESIPASMWPGWLQVILKYSPPLVADPSDFLNIETHIVASLTHALGAAALESKELGYKLQLHTKPLTGDAVSVGRWLAGVLIDNPSGVHIWGGETTVEVPPDHGRGGRNQHLALAVAEIISGRNDVFILAAGTDGSDGTGEAAGAVVDGGTVSRGALAGLNVADCIRRADAGSFLEKSGDLVKTGPTGTNVMDLVIGMKV